MHSSISLYRYVSKIFLPVFGLYKMQLLLHMYKAIKRIGCHIQVFTMNQSHYSTRHNTNLFVKRCRLETTKQRVEYDINIQNFNLSDKPNEILQEIDTLLL